MGSFQTGWKVRGALKDATSAVHERLHGAHHFKAIAEERLNLEDYADLLLKTAAFHFTVAVTLRTSSGRDELLLQDLHTLGAPKPEELAWQAPQNAAGKLGCAYVSEGSMLGGKVIYRQLDYLFGDTAEGRLFYRGAPNDPSRWRALCQQLETVGSKQEALEDMIMGAQRAFDLFEQLLLGRPANV